MSNIKLGLFGFGCVGKGLYDVLQQTQGIQAEIAKICVKNRNKQRPIPADYFTYDKSELLDNPDINVIVELIDDADAAFEIVSTALRKGKAVVTANKKMLAEHFEELLALQRQYQVPLLYEGATCASIPIIRNLEEYYDNDLLQSVEGIVNGSTNYILTKIFQEKLGFEAALKMAQDLGFAESEPSLDIEGYDAKYKLCILLAHAFGILTQPEAISHLGIQKIGELETRYANEKGHKIKLVAQAQRIGNQVAAFVIPKFVPQNHALYLVENEYNGVQIEGAFAEKQFFFGKGAGAYPTGSAVLSDISALTYQYKYAYKKLNQNQQLSLSNDFETTVFVRFHDRELVQESDFIRCTESYFSELGNYIIGSINFSELIALGWLRHPDISVLLTADAKILPAREGSFKEKELVHSVALV